MVKTIIFDWTGVIKDSVRSHLWIVNRIFKTFNVEKISLEELKENWEQPYMLFYKKYLPDLTMAEQNKAYREAIFSKDCPKSKAYPGISKLIKEIKEKGVSIFVVSSDLPDTLYPEIKKYSLENVFNEVFTNVDDKTDIILDLNKKYNFNPDETLIIGDSNHEIEVGKQTGIKTIAVTWGFCSEQALKLKNPDFIAHNLEELEKIIL